MATSTGEELLEGTQPSPLQVAAPVASILFVVAVVLSGAGATTVWHVIRATGVVAYVLLTASVLLGLLITGRAVPSGRPRVDVYEIHIFTSLLALAFGATHALTLLLDNFVSFSPAQILIPFTSSYRPVSVALGVFGIYLLAVIYGSFWARRYIGYTRWRQLHYATFGAFALVSLHGILSGADSHTTWMASVYSISILAVLALTIYRIANAPGRTRRLAVR